MTTHRLLAPLALPGCTSRHVDEVFGGASTVSVITGKATAPPPS